MSYEKVIEYLQGIHSYKIETPKRALLYNVNMSDVKQTMTFSNLNSLELKKCSFSNSNMMLFDASDVQSINITDCHFKDFSVNVFNARRISSLNLKNCTFRNCTMRDKTCYDKLYVDRVPGAIAVMDNIGSIFISNVKFHSCYTIIRKINMSNFFGRGERYADEKNYTFFTFDYHSKSDDIIIKESNATVPMLFNQQDRIVQDYSP